MTTATTTLPTLASAQSAGADAAAETAANALPPFALTRPLPGARVIASIDMGLMIGALIGTVTGNAMTWPESVSAFLSLTISVGHIVYLSTFAATAVTIFWAAGLYDATRVRRRASEVVRVIFAVTAITAIAPVFLTDAQAASIDGAAGIQFWITAVGLVVTARTVRARVTRSAARCRRALIVGSGPHAVRVCRELSGDPATSYRVLGFVDTADETPFRAARSSRGARSARSTSSKRMLVREHVDEVHVGLPVEVALPADPGDHPRLRAHRREGDVRRRHFRHRARAAADRRRRRARRACSCGSSPKGSPSSSSARSTSSARAPRCRAEPADARRRRWPSS